MNHAAIPLKLLGLFLVVSGVGCAATPASARKAMPKPFPSHVERWHGGRLTEVEFVTDFRLPPGGRVQIAGFDTALTPLPPTDDNTREPAEKAKGQFSETVAEGIRKTTKTYVPVDTVASGSSSFSSAPYGAAKADTLIVRGRVLQLDPGSRAARYWVGFGVGASRVAIEGELVDAKTSRTVARFRHSHGTGGGMFGGDYDQILRSDALTIGQDLGVLLLAYVAPQ